MLDFILWLDAVDRAVFIFVNSTIANPVTDFIMPFLTKDLHLKIFYGLGLLGILWKGDNRLRFAVIFSLITVTFTDQLSSSLLKPLLGRPRPCHEFEVHLLVGCGGGLSMPSSHAANLFGQAFFFKKIAPISARYLVPLAIVVALSRVFVGVHYPADIIVGAALGTLAGLAVAAVSNKIRPMVIKNIPKEVTETMPVEIEVRQGDITEADTEAVVNAANNHLWMGSGVAGAIKRKGGDEIEKDAMAKGPIEVGEAVESTAGRLPFKYVIHAAGMGQDLRTDEDIVYRVTKNSILLADRLGLKSLAFPAIGTGVGGFPLNVCARVMIRAAKELSNELKSIERIQFVLFDDEGYKAFSAEFEKSPQG